MSAAEVPGKTENLHIRSLVGRYLEHGRIYSFYDGVTTRIYIASGDFLTRNTECRVEVGVRVEDPVLIQKLSDILQLQLRDNVNAREMRADGSYQKVKAAPGEPLVNGQMDMYDLLRDDWLARDTASAAEPEQPEPKAPERRLSRNETGAGSGGGAARRTNKTACHGESSTCSGCAERTRSARC